MGFVLNQNKTRVPGEFSSKAFYVDLFLTCASTLMYEIVLTRLLSVLCGYYLAFVSISMAMFGMTAGALAIQFRPNWFEPADVSKPLTQAAIAAGVSRGLDGVQRRGLCVDRGSLLPLGSGSSALGPGSGCRFGIFDFGEVALQPHHGA